MPNFIQPQSPPLLARFYYGPLAKGVSGAALGLIIGWEPETDDEDFDVWHPLVIDKPGMRDIERWENVSRGVGTYEGDGLCGPNVVKGIPYAVLGVWGNE